MRKKADSVNIWSRYLKGTPAQEIYTRYKKALSEESRAMQFSQKMEFYLMAKDDDELMAAIACFTPPQMDTVLRGVHKIVCNDPTIVADMKNVHQEEKMNTFLKKTVQYWGAVEDEKVNEAIGAFTNFEKITLLRVLHKQCISSRL